MADGVTLPLVGPGGDVTAKAATRDMGARGHVQQIELEVAGTITLSNLASGVASASALASNVARRGVLMFNDDANAVLIKYGAVASVTSYTVKIPADSYWEMPFPIYTGAIDAIWLGDGTGSLRITELA